MGLCTGCAVSFGGLDAALCMKCVKLAAVHSSTEREAIEVSLMTTLQQVYYSYSFELQKQPQCERLD